jgi:DNA-binding NarL/FixJ family response regulator
LTQKRILLVEDEDVIRESVAEILELNGFQVLTASDGLQALSLLEHETPDLILADIMMPQMNGYQFFQRVRSNPDWVWIPFIFLSAKGAGEDVRFGKELGVDDYLRKPIDAEDLISAVIGRLHRYKALTENKAQSPDPSSGYEDPPTRPAGMGFDITTREREVLILMVKGKTNNEIASELFIGTATVKTHVSNILSKLDASNRVEAVTRAIDLGLDT